ncbi:MAG: hypothetical protein QOF51_2885 [Chloroflexota bacterium]|nr:hypothetical protein [Chloroflexota bacterium]
MERKRLVADRYIRIWAIAEFVARQPGLNRSELAQRFSLSERQLQADLNIIREEIGLPLMRVHGYRFNTAEPQGQLTLRDVYPLYLLMEHALQDPAMPAEAIRDLSARLPCAFPVPLQPLARKALTPRAEDDYGPTPDVFAHLADALVRQQTIKLKYLSRVGIGYLTEPIVDPHIMMPHEESWYLIGRCHQRKRVIMFPLDTLDSVSYDL